MMKNCKLLWVQYGNFNLHLKMNYEKNISQLKIK